MAMETTSERRTWIKPVVHLMVGILLYCSSLVIPLAFLVDFLLGALCPGEVECSQVIILTGSQQLITGLGGLVMAPILGSLSDGYGRKPVLLILIYAAIVPPILQAYSRSKVVVYAWFFAYLVVNVLREGGLMPLILAYVADVVDERQRPSAVGLAMSAAASAFLFGTVAARAIKRDYQAFWFSAAVQISAALYVTIFLKETNSRCLLPSANSQSESNVKLVAKPVFRRQRTSLGEIVTAVSSSRQLQIIALVDFMNTFGMAGLQAFVLFYLKAIFNFGKDEFAEIVIIAGVSAVIGQMFLYPSLAHYLGERGVIWIGLPVSAGHFFLYGFAWTRWVPFLTSAMAVFYSCIQPCLGSMVSKGAEPEEQGRIQGFMGGIRSAGTILAPLVLTPLATASLGENPPLNFRGLPFIICGFVSVAAWLISLGLGPDPHPEQLSSGIDFIQAPLPPDDFIHVQTPPEDLLRIPLHSASHREEAET